jgi:hypothetical protein
VRRRPAPSGIRQPRAESGGPERNQRRLAQAELWSVWRLSGARRSEASVRRGRELACGARQVCTRRAQEQSVTDGAGSAGAAQARMRSCVRKPAVQVEPRSGCGSGGRATAPRWPAAAREQSARTAQA